MKSEQVFLAGWMGQYNDGYDDIPWPRVHDQASTAAVSWLNLQDPVDCQLILEKLPNSNIRMLWAEFYNPKLHLEYQLKFG
jgi:hypothetical protein